MNRRISIIVMNRDAEDRFFCKLAAEPGRDADGRRRAGAGAPPTPPLAEQAP